MTQIKSWILVPASFSTDVVTFTFGLNKQKWFSIDYCKHLHLLRLSKCSSSWKGKSGEPRMHGFECQWLPLHAFWDWDPCKSNGKNQSFGVGECILLGFFNFLISLPNTVNEGFRYLGIITTKSASNKGHKMQGEATRRGVGLYRHFTWFLAGC